MNETEWVIGADPTADVWLEHPDISGFHCRITQTSSGFMLEDLNSTNGTFCNGHRVQSAVVSVTDDIQLASRVPMPWPIRGLAQRVIGIGYAPENHCRLTDDSVSGRHAEMIVDPNGQLVLRDLGSTNGTWIGQRSITAVVLKPTDTFRAGLVDLTPEMVLKQAGLPKELAQPGVNSGLSETHHQGASIGTMLVLIGIPVVIGIMCMLLVFRSVLNHSPKTTQGDVPVAVASVVETRPGKKQPEKLDEANRGNPGESDDIKITSPLSQGESGNSSQSNGQTAETVAAAEASSQDKLPATGLQAVRQAMFLIIAKLDGQSFDFATAWAVKPDVLVTNAHVIESIQRNGFSVSAIHISSGAEVSIASVGYHPKYLGMRKELLDLTSKVEQQLQEVEHARESSLSEQEVKSRIKSISEIKQQIPWKERAVDACDVGWIQLAPQSLSPMSQLVPKSIAMQKNKELRLVNTLIEKDSAVFDPEDKRVVGFVRLRAAEPVLHEDTSTPQRWKSRFESDEFSYYVFDGCPIVDLRGRLVGMYRGAERQLVADQEATEKIDMIAPDVINETLNSLPPRTSQ